MSDHTPSLGGGELFEEVTTAARQALSVARRRSPHLHRSFKRGRVRGQQVQRYAISRTRRIRSVDNDRTDPHRNAQQPTPAGQVDAGDLSRAAMLARWATAVAAAEAAREVVADLDHDGAADAARDAAQLDAENAQIHVEAWEDRLLTDEGIDVSGLATEPTPDLDLTNPELTGPDIDTAPLTAATTAATADLADTALEPVPDQPSVGIYEQSGLGADPESTRTDTSSSFDPGPQHAQVVDLDAGLGLDN